MKKHHVLIIMGAAVLAVLAWYWWSKRTTGGVTAPADNYSTTTSNALPAMPALQWPNLGALVRHTNNSLFPIWGFVSSPGGQFS